MKLNPCKRMLVKAFGVKEIFTATNGNIGECTGEVGKCGCIHAEDNKISTYETEDLEIDFEKSIKENK